MIYFHLSLTVSCGTAIFPEAKQMLQIGNCGAKYPSSNSGMQFINAFDDNYRSGNKPLLTLRCLDYLCISFVILTSAIEQKLPLQQHGHGGTWKPASFGLSATGRVLARPRQEGA